MKKAAIIFVYKDPEQANILIKQLISDNQTDVFVHVDKKNENIKSKIIKNENIFIIDNNINVEWGSDSLLNAQLLACKEVINKKKYEYLISCSGADIMIKNGLDDFLEKNKGTVFIDSYEQDKVRRIYLLRKWPSSMRKLRDNMHDPHRIFRRLLIEMYKKGFPVFRKKVDYNISEITFYKCWFWFAMPIEVVEYILEFISKNETFMQIFEGALVADEGFWATIIMNSAYKDRIKYNNKLSKSLTFLYKLNRNSHPPVLTMKDIDILESSNMYFARKFDINVDKTVIEYFYNKVINGSN